MPIDRVSNSIPDPADQRLFQEINRRDPRFGGAGAGGAAGQQQQATPEAAKSASAASLGSDRLRFKGEPPTNPFEVLLRNRQRKKKKKQQDGDPTTL